MARLDRERGQVVVRVVYDGPALAGKTTTVRALARSLGRDVFSGDEAEGRTLHFDWLDYVGGRFEGNAIRCQVVAVPGQTALASRRMRLLEEADAVVFVGDSRASAVEDNLRSLDELRGFLAAKDAPRAGVVLQANKRDAPDAVPLDVLRARLDIGPTVGVTESIATDGTGVRETFVFAVRLALDLVRERLAGRRLETGPPAAENGEALLASLLAAESETGIALGALAPPAEAPAAPAAVETGPEATVVSTARVAVPPPPVAPAPPPLPTEATPRAPDATVPSGLVWPPIEGRLVLHEAHALGVVPRRLKNGDWWAVAGDTWRCHSQQAAEFGDLDSGREALVTWARWHAGLVRWLSPKRCIALCQSGPSRWRLWQIVRREPALKSRIVDALAASDAEAAALVLLRAVEALRAAQSRLAPLGLPVAASSVAYAETAGALYVGLVPHAAMTPAPAIPLVDLVRRTIGPVIRESMAASPIAVPALLERLKSRAQGQAPADVVETLQAILIGH